MHTLQTIGQTSWSNKNMNLADLVICFVDAFETVLFRNVQS